MRYRVLTNIIQLDPKQFLMKRKSTNQALVYFLHTILAELDSGENYVRIFFVDFNKKRLKLLLKIKSKTVSRRKFQ